MRFKSPRNDMEIRDQYKKDHLIDLIDNTKPNVSYLQRTFKDPDQKDSYLGGHYIQQKEKLKFNQFKEQLNN